MPDPDATRAVIAELWHKVVRERERAARAATLADQHERSAAEAGEVLREIRLRLAGLHRTTEERHRISAQLQAAHAVRLQAWLDSLDGRGERPGFVAAIAATLGVPSVLVTLVDDHRRAAVAAASDASARAAYDIEVVLGEGPADLAISTGQPVCSGGAELVERFPYFGPVVGQLGVRSLVAVPLRQPITCVGALCVFDREPVIGTDLVASTGRVADALVRSVLFPPGAPDPGDGDPLWLFGAEDYQDVVHQAAGMVSVLHDCAPDDALALIRARAFVTGRPADEVARRIVAADEVLD